MQLIVNNDMIDFELEGEEYLNQLMPALFYLLKSQGYYNINASIDGELIDFSSRLWQEKPIELIKTLTITASVVLEIEQCLAQVDALLQAISQNQASMTTEAMASWDDVVESIAFWLIDFKLDDSFFSALKSLNILLTTGSASESSIKLLKMASFALEEKDRELTYPLQQLKAAATTLQSHKEHLLTISTLFARGADQQAMQSMLTFMESVQKFSRCGSFLGDHLINIYQQCLHFSAEIDEQTNAFSLACEQKDYILAGDIAEYELAERLTMLDAIIAAITLEDK